MQIRLGHSADPDDAFMVWALASGRIDARGFDFELVPEDIQVLNEWALELGEWWLLETGLPLPLGVNVARRDLPRLDELSDVLRESITAGLAHRREATEYALGFARDLDRETANRFIEMYVNERTCDYGDEGRQAVAELLRRAESTGTYDRPVRVEFVGS